MNSFNNVKRISSWAVFLIAAIVYFLSAERTGSLWDCGEFILGAYKLEVVHPPGAPLFMIIGRLFTWMGSLFSDDPANIAFAVNLMSGIATAFTAFFVAQVTMMFGKLSLVGRGNSTDQGQNVALGFAGLAAGLSTAFCSSIWFSAVEGEVYAMSTMFTALTFWAATKWYYQADEGKVDRWLVLSIYCGGLSVGVHLLSLLTFPAIALMYYFKKYEKVSIFGLAAALLSGVGLIYFIQKVVIVGIPTLWKNMELFAVNEMGLPFHSGLVITLLLLTALAVTLLRASHGRSIYLPLGLLALMIILTGIGYDNPSMGSSLGKSLFFTVIAGGLLYFLSKDLRLLNLLVVAGILVSIGFSTIGVIVIRANADTPINMNVPSDALRLLPYLNREQYGERALLFGPAFDKQPSELLRENRYGRVGDKYEIVDEKLDYAYRNQDKMFLPRIGHSDGPRPELHKQWYRALNGKELKGSPGFGYNLQFMMKYQFGWMYWRYFFWNFAGKQNGKQGYYGWDVSDGNWMSGIKPLDEARLHNLDQITDSMENNKAYNKYYMLPFIFGLIGLFFLAKTNMKNATILLTLFLITGIGITLYSNQPPNEPRERDYVLVGSFFTYCMFIGMGVLALFRLLANRLNFGGVKGAALAGLVIMMAPFLMGTQNFDDHSRRKNYGSRDYAANFLNSVDENAIIFTYGDNDTYPLWYAQEVENIRRDVRVVNLSLIAVDWYIEKLRNKVNDSAPLKLTLDTEAYRGKNRNQVFFFDPENPQDDKLMQPRNVFQELAFIGNRKNNIKGQTIMRTRSLMLPIDANDLVQKGLWDKVDSTTINQISFKLPKRGYITKDELAVMDVVSSNIQDRAIYFAVTCNNEKLLGLNDYMQLEGLALRVIPEKNKGSKNLSIYGSGKVETEKVYNNVMNKWAWGNFDKEETFVEDSYGAELQAMRIVMMRTANEYLKRGDKTKAAALANKYFESFPHFNFTYDESITPFLNVLVGAGDDESAKKHARILAKELSQRMVFYDSLDDDDFESSFRQDFQYAVSGIQDLLDVARNLKDPAFLDEINSLVGQFDIRSIKN